jgi:hypothetical protein
MRFTIHWKPTDPPWNTVHGWWTNIISVSLVNHKLTLSPRQWGCVLKESFRLAQLFISVKVYPRDRSQPTVLSPLSSCVSLNTALQFRKGMSAPNCVPSCTRLNNWHNELHFINIAYSHLFVSYCSLRCLLFQDVLPIKFTMTPFL